MSRFNFIELNYRYIFSHLIILSFFLFSQLNTLGAQELIGISADWDNSLKEWTIYTTDDHLEGELQTRWMIDDDWSDWSIRFGQLDGRIKMKWKDDPNEWEFRSGNITINARTVFKNDFREWRIVGSRHTVNIKTRFGNIFDEWDASNNQGQFYLRTAYQGDPRDWQIEDELETTPLEIKVVLVFIALYTTTFLQ